MGRKRTLASSRVCALVAAFPNGTVNIGTAGWSIGSEAAAAFPVEGTSLERYSAVFTCTEINSSFHRPHRASTWERWRDSVPPDFRFAVKLPKTVTHQARLVETEELLDTFAAEVALVKENLAVLLVQLPPSLALDGGTASSFFRLLRQRIPAMITVEPRHASWFEADASDLLREHGVSRVGADPARVPEAAEPLVAEGLAYWRLHGSPAIYRSSYADRIDALADRIRASEAREKWCIFDNTASSAATGDALLLRHELGLGQPT